MSFPFRWGFQRFPEVHTAYARHGRQPRRSRVARATVRHARRLHHRDVGRREGIGPRKCAHGDVLRRPRANAGDAREGGERLVDRRAGVKAKRSGAISRASATIARAREAMMPRAAMSPGRGSEIAAGGKSRSSPSRGVSSGSPNAVTKRPAIVVAAATEICWPRIARTAISKPSTAPGTRNPGLAAASAPSAREISSGRHRGRTAASPSQQRRHDAGEGRARRQAQRGLARRGRDLDPAGM